jgi:hypothetical protein
MNKIKLWWNNDLPKSVKFVLLVLLANGLPAFIILMSMPGKTEDLFVWTINPTINARLVGVMYFNALLLVGFSAFQITWVNVRINFVVITLFSIFATLLTFFYLKPFLAHPWYHLAYWLTMYLILFFVAPYVFITQEKKSGGKLPIQIPLNVGARVVACTSLVLSLICGLGLLFNIELVNQYWPWKLPPLVGGLIGVLFLTHAAAYTWALWDVDWIRVRSMFWQAPPTGLLLILLPMTHAADLKPEAGNTLTLYYALAGYAVLANLGIIFWYRSVEKRFFSGKN